MRQRGQGRGASRLESRERVGASCETASGRTLMATSPPEARVAGAIDLPHPARPERPENFVRTQLGSPRSRAIAPPSRAVETGCSG